MLFSTAERPPAAPLCTDPAPRLAWQSLVRRGFARVNGARGVATTLKTVDDQTTKHRCGDGIATPGPAPQPSWCGCRWQYLFDLQCVEHQGRAPAAGQVGDQESPDWSNSVLRYSTTCNREGEARKDLHHLPSARPTVFLGRATQLIYRIRTRDAPCSLSRQPLVGVRQPVTRGSAMKYADLAPIVVGKAIRCTVRGPKMTWPRGVSAGVLV